MRGSIAASFCTGLLGILGATLGVLMLPEEAVGVTAGYTLVMTGLVSGLTRTGIVGFFAGEFEKLYHWFGC